MVYMNLLHFFQIMNTQREVDHVNFKCFHFDKEILIMMIHNFALNKKFGPLKLYI